MHFLTQPHHLTALEPLKNAAMVALDIETAGPNGLIPQQSRIRLLQLATEDGTFVFDMDKVQPPEWVWEILESPSVLKVLHNAKFDLKHIYHHTGRVVAPVFCTFLASQLLALGNSDQRHSLAATVKRYLNVVLDKSQQVSDWSGELSEEQVLYAASDVEILLKLQPILAERLKRLKLGRVSQLEFRTVMPVAIMEWRGVRVDLEKWQKQSAIWQAKRDELERQLLTQLRLPDDLPGMNTLNLNAPEQVLSALRAIGVDLQGTSESQLKQWENQFPVISDLLAYRHLNRILTATMQQIAQCVLPETGRVHSSYFQIASASGRFACSEPNIQQVPREKEIRSCFVPEPGNCFIIADYSQVELRVAAGLAHDRTMLEAYRNGWDLHRLTAALSMNKNIDEVSASERQAAKAINFGLIYAMGPNGLMQSARNSYGVDMSLDQATTFRHRFFQNYAGIRNWQEELERQGRKNRFVRTAAGRIRSYEGEEIRVTELFNIPVQGTAAEGLKSALCLFWDKTRELPFEAHIVAIIHDEIIVEVAESKAQACLELLKSCMIQGIQWLVPNVPFAVDAHIGQSWADK
ncbi:MAG: bifunctional 3'-5' exonuclease/DNA polymerase [Acidobacteria bacterium]|nr:bifunctional 3'-5' exonuclease/DNA polymerase [Acidobacteriota bacterium]